MNTFFQSEIGIKKTIIVNEETTIDKLLKKFLYTIDHPELIGNNNKIYFLFNYHLLKFGDQTPVKEYFGNNNPPLILFKGL